MRSAQEFGAFRLDPARRRLETTDGRRVALTAKAFDALVCLVDRAGQPVSRNVLIHELWPNTVVEENNLTQTIAALRRALGRDYIVTLPGRGYQLVAVPRQVEASPHAAHWLVSSDQRLPLVRGENVIGRDPQADVWLDHSTVSRRHARIFVDSEKAMLEDLGSKNGTSVDGIKLREPAALRHGDRIGFGMLYLTFRESSAGLSTVTQISRVGGHRPDTGRR